MTLTNEQTIDWKYRKWKQRITDGYQLALKELERRYGNPEILVKSFINKALTWPQIKPDDCKELDNYALFLSECKNAITRLEDVCTTSFCVHNKEITQVKSTNSECQMNEWIGTQLHLQAIHKPLQYWHFIWSPNLNIFIMQFTWNSLSHYWLATAQIY